MRILYAVQRYGEDIVGGSEAACRQFTEHLAGRGHEVEVLTSSAKSYVDWSQHYEPGVEEINGVTVHRLPTLAPRRPEIFGPLDGWMHGGPHPVPMWCQQRWAKVMGPDLVGQRHWLVDNTHRFDVAIFMTYLYATTTRGLPVAAGRLPTILQPTAHDEPPFRIPLMESIFRQPDALLFFTPEERDTVTEQFRIRPLSNVVGIGIDLLDDTDPAAFRRAHELDDRPYLLYAGRFDTMKGAVELVEFFGAYKSRTINDLQLVFAGESLMSSPPHPDIKFVGFLDEYTKRSALAGALALIQPSYFESFSIVLCEAWVQRRPALVQGRSPVLSGQAARSGGAIAFRGFAEFESAVELLTAHDGLADAMGLNGRRYVEDNYRWDTVLDGVEVTIQDAIGHFERRRGAARR